ncbi:FecR family protein [Dyadobacter sp. BHUBP1]|uniref:FecR family protein n=1 Tax=Dyadobacter sp. BHUBP1 TaxID=3424178 RepID=UPI003D358144
MKHVQAINLMRRFIDDQCTKEEVTSFIALMAFDKHRKLYGRLIDETIESGKVGLAPISERVILQRYQVLEQRLIFPETRIDREKPIRRRYYLAAAAIAGIILIAALAIYRFSPFAVEHYETGFGEIRNVNLSDGSVVTLNGNSAIDFHITTGAVRTVELQGEAFFRVSKTPDLQKFRVVMPGTGKIEVLGTEFNVRHRAGGSQVVLRSGSIRLSTTGQSAREVIMKPGELVEITPNAAVVRHEKVNPAEYDRWTTHKLVFDNTPLREIVNMLRDTYGLDVVIDDPRLLDKKLSGTAPVHDLDTFLEALSGSFDLRIDRKQNKVFISAH